MKLAVMQPYFMPYIGYFQLIAAVDTFVVYDNIKYTKKGWINRNRMLVNGQDAMFSLPLKKASDTLDVVERELAADFEGHALLKQWWGAYAKAPHFGQTYSLLERIMAHDARNLFRFIHASLIEICHYLCIRTDIIVSSQIPIDHQLKAQEKVIALCTAVGADTYINPMGGVELYDKERFAGHGIDLHFLRPKPLEYAQFGSDFVPWLSIIDVLMFNPREQVMAWVDHQYELL